MHPYPKDSLSILTPGTGNAKIQKFSKKITKITKSSQTKNRDYPACWQTCIFKNRQNKIKNYSTVPLRRSPSCLVDFYLILSLIFIQFPKNTHLHKNFLNCASQIFIYLVSQKLRESKIKMSTYTAFHTSIKLSSVFLNIFSKIIYKSYRM